MEFIKKYWKWIVSILLILLIGYGYWRYTKQEALYERVKNLMEIGIFEEREFEDIEFETTNTVYNTANKDFYDEVVQVGLRELGMDSMIVSIKQITQSSKDKFDIDTELRAHILPNGSRGNNYVIWIDDMGRFESIVVLSHELIHLEQYQNKELVIEEDGIVWKRIKFTYQDISYIDYRTRPWERDAFNKEKTLRFKIQDILYGDN
jgi:hypothetical protein